MNSRPLVSIVMPSFQQAAFLEEAVRSVLDQRISGTVELLVMDPGSQDGSRELLAGLQHDYGDRLVLYFESDRGQSDALNRGFSRTSGKILGWLNSDDRLRPGALAKITGWLDTSEPRWIYGRAGMIDAAGKPHTGFIVKYKNWRGRRFSRLKLLTENFIPQMAVFWNRAMWEKVDGLDVDRHLDMDYDLWMRFAQISQPRVLDDILADFRVHGESKGTRQTSLQLDAAFATARKHAADLGFSGQAALWVHRLLGWRTRLLYRFLKPGSG